MILITHQRSGSEWFLYGLEDIKYHGWEILGDMDRIVGTSFSQFQNISTSARINMLKSAPKTRAHKIHFSNLRRESSGSYWPAILKVLQERDDVYLLTRQNTRAALISFMIALKNRMNFHESSASLTTRFTVTRDELVRWYAYLGTDVNWARQFLAFKEEFTYEGLLGGTEAPSTVKWNAATSRVQRRGSADFIHLITNYNEVVGWMDELQVPGAIP